MDQELNLPAVDGMGLELSHVVGDLVQGFDLLRRDPQHFLKRLPGEVGHRLPVREGAIRPGVHRREISPAFLALDRSADQFLLSDRDPVFLARPFEDLEVIGADLVAERPRTGVDREDDLPREEPERVRPDFIVDFIHVLDL